jgi:LytS/YehU family sensor histidine kinase
LLVPVFAILVSVVYADPATALLISFLRQSIGFSLTLGLWLVYRRWPAATFRWSAHAWQIAGCCLAAATADALLAELLRRALDIAEPPAAVGRGAIVLRFALYVAWSALYFAIRQELGRHAAELRTAQDDANSREAQLQLLQAQFNPHFLLNSLLTVNSLAESNPAAVRELALAMADYLRYSAIQRAHHAPLGDELAAITSYLRIAQINHAALGFAWSIDASDGARAALVPTALVQPLVENAIKYGSMTSRPPLRVTITARIVDEKLWLAVENTGAWVNPPSWEHELDATSGIGLSNLRRRLELLHGEGTRLEVLTPESCVRVEARLPLQSTETAMA